MKRRGFFGGVWATLVALFGVRPRALPAPIDIGTIRMDTSEIEKAVREAMPEIREVIAFEPLFKPGDVVRFISREEWFRKYGHHPNYVINISGVMSNEQTQDVLRRMMDSMGMRRATSLQYGKPSPVLADAIDCIDAATTRRVTE